MTRMRSITLWLLALGLAGNGLFMLLGPEAWYHRLPTVPATGPRLAPPSAWLLLPADRRARMLVVSLQKRGLQ